MQARALLHKLSRSRTENTYTHTQAHTHTHTDTSTHTERDTELPRTPMHAPEQPTSRKNIIQTLKNSSAS